MHIWHVKKLACKTKYEFITLEISTWRCTTIAHGSLSHANNNHDTYNKRAQYLVCKEFDMFVAQHLRPDDGVQIRRHELCHDVDVMLTLIRCLKKREGKNI